MMVESLKAAIVGYGKMGKCLEEVLQERGHVIVHRISREDPLEPVREADVAFEFSRPEAAPNNVLRLLDLGVATVCGTTGWDVSRAETKARRTGTALMVGSNFSIGAALLFRLAHEAAVQLANVPEFEAALLECHHRAKIDAPSGTARKLAELMEAAAGKAPAIVAMRVGRQPGQHTVLFEGPDESVELVHRARSRKIFAFGAVRAAEWLLASGLRGWVPLETFWEETRP